VRRVFPVLMALLLLLVPGPAFAAGFRDLAPTPWATAAVAVLAAQGVVKGVAPGRFAPAVTVSRETLAVMLARLFALQGSSPLPFRDRGQVSPWARRGVAAAIAAGILNGVGHGRLLPRAPLDRAEAVTMLARAFHLTSRGTLPYRDAAAIPSWARAATAALTRAGIVAGFPDGRFEPGAHLTRAELAVLLARAEALSQRTLPLPSTLVGAVGTVVYPDAPGLVAQGRGEGAGGGVELGRQAIRPVAPAASLFLGPNGDPATLFALSAGDPALAVLGRDGTVEVLWDLAPPPVPPAIRDADATHLYLSDGTVRALPKGVVFSFAGRTAPFADVGALLGSTVTGLTGTTVHLGTLAFAGVLGTVLALDPGTVTVLVRSDPTGLLGTGPTVFTLPKAAAVATSPGAPPLAAGTDVVLMGEASPGTQPVLVHLLY
jgi:hypothetical protein